MFFALLAKLKEIRSGKMSIILEPRLNSGLRGEKDGKTPYFLAISKHVNQIGERLVVYTEGIIYEGFDEMIL